MALKAGVADIDWESSLSQANAPGTAVPLERQVNKDYSFPKTLSFPYQGVGHLAVFCSNGSWRLYRLLGDGI